MIIELVDLGSQTGIGDWMIYDTARSPFSNPTNQNNIALNEPNQEDDFYNASQAQIDILSNGFKIRKSGAYINTNNETYFYWAIADSPIKYANGAATHPNK